MAKLVLNDVGNLTGAEQSAITSLNTNAARIEAALENTLSRDGTGPNQMSADIDMNGNDILNVARIDADSLTLNGSPLIPIDLGIVGPNTIGTPQIINEAVTEGKLAKIFPGGTGGIGRTPIQVIRDQIPSVLWYGAVGGGGATAAADTAAINAALAAHKIVSIPAGDFRPTTTLQVQTGGGIIGAGFEATRINRNNYFSGPTIQVGTEATSSGNFIISGLFIDNPHPGFDASVSTQLGSNRLLEAQAHIKVWGGTQGRISRCFIQNAVYNVDVAGHTGLVIEQNLMLGVWDQDNTDRQECRANIRFGRTAGLPYTTECIVRDNYLAGVSNVSRTISMPGSTGTFVARLDGGAQYGIQIDAAEGLKIVNNYIGANNQYGVFFLPNVGSILTNVDINGNFFDGARIASIGIAAITGAFSNMISIRGNRFNGQEITPNVLNISSPDSNPSCYSLIFADNQTNAHLKAPLLLSGVRGARIIGNIVEGYNSRNIFTGVDANSGAFVSTPSREVHFSSNLWGGAVNNLGATNNCKYGVVGDGTATGSTNNERGILGTGGGSLVAGTNFAPQTYPT